MKRLLAAAVAVVMMVAGLAGAASAKTADHAGEYQAIITAPLEFTPLDDGRCQITATGVLVFTGTIVGSAPGTTVAVTNLPCDQVSIAPPNFTDEFKFEGSFTGLVAGVPVQDIKLTWRGSTAVGGAITSQMKFHTPRTPTLASSGIIGVGGTYQSR